MSKFLIKSASRIFTIAASLAFAGNAMAQEKQSLHVDPNGSCMEWYFEDSQNGKTYSCSGESSVKSRGRCRAVKMPIGTYRFWYGQQSYHLKVDDNSQVSFVEARPENIGLTITGEKLNFQNSTVTLDNNSFPGTFAVSGEDITLINAPKGENNGQGCVKATTPKNQLSIMKGAQFHVSGSWTVGDDNVTNYGNLYRIIDDKLVPKGTAQKPLAFSAENNSMTISPNPYFWMRTKEATQDMLVRGLTTNGAKPVIVSQGSCPAGNKKWDKAEGRFLLGAANPIKQNGDNKTGGQAKVTLQKRHIPAHQHQYQRNAVAHHVARGGEAWGMTNTDLSTTIDTKDKGDLRGEAHNNVPPYIAVNFCELK